MERPAYVSSLVAPFARGVLAVELPGLPAERAEAALEFVFRRMHGLPSPMRVGVLLVAAVVRAVMFVPILGPAVPAWLCAHPLPILGEYARLVKSLGLAHVFEEWPDSRGDGSPVAVTV